MKWPLVTGRDFARSIKWARTQKNPIDEAIRKKISEIQNPPKK